MVPSTKSLGVHVDQNLNCDCKKIASALGTVKRIGHLAPFYVAIDVYNIIYFNHILIIVQWCLGQLQCSPFWKTTEAPKPYSFCILLYAIIEDDINKLFQAFG